MNYLKNISIENFKGYKANKINFAPLTVLVGANSAGKSTLIQSMLLARKAYLNSTAENKSILKLNDKFANYIELGSTEEIFSFHTEENQSKRSKINKDKIAFKIANSKKNIFEVISSSFFDKENSLSVEFEVNVKKPSGFNLLSENFHYLNSERIGPRSHFEMRGDSKLNVGFQGEYTSDVLATISSKDLKDYTITDGKKWKSSYDENLDDLVSESMSKHIEAWFQFLFPESELRIVSYPNMNTVQLSLRKRGLETFLNPNNMGFGLSYSLPVLVTGVVSTDKELFIVENPEAHLHPKSQSRMGQFLAKMAGTGTQTIIETHSEHIVNGICLGVLKGFIKPENIVINYFKPITKGEVEIEILDVDKDGKLSDWPIGFFDQTLTDYAEMGRLRRK